jgi:hypothetical protein
MLKKASSLSALAGACALALGAAAPQPALATTVTPTPCDFVTGGGYVFKDDGQMANYGVHAGCKNGEFWGHINYVDHGLGLHVRSTEITLYVRETLADGTVLENTRDFCGKAIVNEDTENPRWFRVTVTDNGEPGRGSDLFGISLDGMQEYVGTRFYMVTERNTAGGNLQLHKGNRSNVAPSPLPPYWRECGDLTGNNAP